MPSAYELPVIILVIGIILIGAGFFAMFEGPQIKWAALIIILLGIIITVVGARMIADMHEKVKTLKRLLKNKKKKINNLN